MMINFHTLKENENVIIITVENMLDVIPSTNINRF